MSEIFNIIPKNTDTCLHFRFRFFFRMQSFTSAILDFAVDWISIQEFIRIPTVSLAVGKVTEVECTTGPKQRTN